MHAHEDVPYRVSNIPQPIFDAWTRMELKSGHSSFVQTSLNSPRPVFMHPDRLYKIRKTLLDRPLASLEAIVKRGIDVDEEDREQRQLYLAHQSMLKKRRRDKDNDRKVSSTMESATKTVASDKTEEARRELFVAQKRQRQKAPEVGVTLPAKPTFNFTSHENEAMTANLLDASPLADVRVGQSASSKLNFILNEVCKSAHSL